MNGSESKRVVEAVTDDWQAAEELLPENFIRTLLSRLDAAVEQDARHAMATAVQPISVVMRRINVRGSELITEKLRAQYVAEAKRGARDSLISALVNMAMTADREYQSRP